MQRLQREDLQNQQIESALHEVGRSAHIVSTRLPMVTIAPLHSVIKRSGPKGRVGRGAEGPRGRGAEGPKGRGAERPRGRGAETPKGRRAEGPKGRASSIRAARREGARRVAPRARWRCRSRCARDPTG